MIIPTLEEFKQLAHQGNLIPVYRELPADLETPVSVFLKLRGDGPAFLLESVEGGEQIGRYPFLAVNPQRRITSYDDHFMIHENGEAVRQPLHAGHDPLSPVESHINQFKLVELPNLPRFIGGAVGYMSYDLVRDFERLPATAQDDLHLPLCQSLLTDTLVIFDNVKHKLLIRALAHPARAPQTAFAAPPERICA